MLIITLLQYISKTGLWLLCDILLIVQYCNATLITSIIIMVNGTKPGLSKINCYLLPQVKGHYRYKHKQDIQTICTNYIYTNYSCIPTTLFFFTFFSMNSMHSSNLASVDTRELLLSLDTVRVLTCLAIFSNSVKYDSLLLMLSVTLTSLVWKEGKEHYHNFSKTHFQFTTRVIPSVGASNC